MATRKKEETPVTSNNSNNTNVNSNNNIHYNNITNSHNTTKTEKKPNWVLRAIVVALIGFVFSILAYYIKNQNNGQPNKAAEIERSPEIKGINAN